MLLQQPPAAATGTSTKICHADRDRARDLRCDAGIVACSRPGPVTETADAAHLDPVTGAQATWLETETSGADHFRWAIGIETCSGADHFRRAIGIETCSGADPSWRAIETESWRAIEMKTCPGAAPCRRQRRVR